MQRYLFRIYYNGRNFSGFQRQPNGLSVENYVELAFIKSNSIISFKENQYHSVSRTDAGVSAICNVFSLALNNEPSLDLLNHNLNIEDIIIWGYCKQLDDLRPRHPKYREYTYILPEEIDKLTQRRFKEFIGTHDFSSFIKPQGAGHFNPLISIYSIEYFKLDNIPLLQIQGQRFGREQIRRMIGYTFDIAFENYNLQKIFLNKFNLNITPVSPYPLILTKIIYHQEMKWKFIETDSNLFLKRSKTFGDLIGKEHIEKTLNKIFNNLVKTIIN